MNKELGTGIVVVAIVMVVMFAECVEEEKAEGIKNKAYVVGYNDLMRYNEECVGEIIYCIGPVVQVMEISDDRYVLGVYVTPKEGTHVNSLGRAWKDAIWVNYEGVRLSEDDVVDIWGEVKGLRTYESVGGSNITIPEIDALHIGLVAEAGEEWWENEAIRKRMQEHWKILGIEDKWFYS